MRLINTQTLQLHFFMENAMPFYAILSHTWENDEVSFQEMSNPVLDPNTTQKQGYAKINNCCAVALRDGYEYVWVDTCCIDKTSSAELSEAINSMYSWYEKAEVCYAYLADYAFGACKGVPEESFKRSKWFTRGWTLQELLAPEDVIFFNGTWKELGTKSSLRDLISEITGIHVAALLGKRLKLYSVAQRMSWASRRQTTRSEDMAYCLMGLFQVNMPMLYGEGDRAFIRLQETIMTRSTDHSIFAWDHPGLPGDSTRGLLASSPSCFMHSSTKIPCRAAQELPFSVTNAGIQISVFMGRTPFTNEDIAILDCTYDSRPTSYIALRLKPYTGTGDKFYVDWTYRTIVVDITERMMENFRQIFIVELDFKKSAPGPNHLKLHIDASALRNISLDAIYPYQGEPAAVTFSPNADGRWVRTTLVFRDSQGRGCEVRIRKVASRSKLFEIDFREARPHIEYEDGMTNLGTRLRVVQSSNKWDLDCERKYWQHAAGWCISAGLKKRAVNGQRAVVLVIEEDVSG